MCVTPEQSPAARACVRSVGADEAVSLPLFQQGYPQRETTSPELRFAFDIRPVQFERLDLQFDIGGRMLAAKNSAASRFKNTNLIMRTSAHRASPRRSAGCLAPSG
jgi:hypothetical protein